MATNNDVEIQEDLDEDFNLEFEVSDEPQVDPVVEPKADPNAERFAQLEKQNQEFAQQIASFGTQKDLLSGLKDVLGTREDTSKLAPKDQRSFEDELADIKDELLDNPDKALKKYSQLLIKHEIAPVVGMMNQEISNLRNELDQTKISGDPVFKDVLDNYGDEVKKIQAQLASQGVRNALQQAVNQVSLGHMTEIIGRQVQAQTAPAAVKGPDALRSPEISSRAGERKSKVIRLTSGEDAHRVSLGLSYEDYAEVYK